jgi:hypothetical protein
LSRLSDTARSGTHHHLHSKETTMNDTLAPVRSLGSDRLLPASATDGVRLALTDRLGLRVGLWLLLRSARRLDSARDHDGHARRLANSRSHDDRLHVTLRSHALSSVRT